MKKKYDKYERAKDFYEKGLPIITHENLRFLAAYFRQELGYGDVRTEKTLLKYCLECEENFSVTNNAGMFESALKFSKFQRLYDVEKVHIYKHELEKIDSIKDFRTQVFVLSLLVYNKANHENSKKYTFNIHILSEILFLANIKMTVSTFVKNYYFLLKSANLSSHKYGNDFFEIKIDKKVGDVAFSIDDFKDIRKQYIRYLGKEFFFCKVCGKKEEKKSGSQSYCKECLSKKRNKSNRI